MEIKKVYSFIPLFFLTLTSFAQEDTTMPVIPSMRALHHDNIIHSLNTIATLKNRNDSVFPVTSDAVLNRAINKSVRAGVNSMRAFIERSSTLDDNAKYKWLRGVNEMLTGFINAYRARMIPAGELPELIKAYADAMKTEMADSSILDIIAEQEPEVGKILMDNYALKDNIGISAARDILVLKSCQRRPENTLSILSQFPNNKYADSLIIMAALRNQEQLYTYASVPDALGKRIRAVDHPLVKIISSLAVSKTGRMYFPFIDNLYRGKITMDSITPLLLQDSSYGYYKLLVRTRIEYVGRMQQGDTPMGMQVLTNRLKFKAVDMYINEINALHEQNDLNIRFKKLDLLTPEELYYLAVLGEDQIYTSSFVSGVYPRIIQRMRNPATDTLLMDLHYDYYKKFIKMCAAYNTLDNFLGKMENSSAQKLMQNFVNGLETTETLEDAVDVADSYASISNQPIKQLILEQVQEKLRESKRQNNKREQVIYNLLNVIFLSMDTSNHIDISARLGIDPVYTMPSRLLKDTSGRIIIQQFSYGDKDAASYFGAFLSRFNNRNWKIIRKPNWVEINSVNAIPITIYANLPLDEKRELDRRAQDSLISYLDEKGLAPTIVIHRGHSYYLSETISRLSPSAKVVLLGSCGGYQKLNDILNICPQAHIISSKQVAAGVLNQSLIDAICERLRTGKDLDWEQLWISVQQKVSAGYKDKFDDYIPPQKNLGAILLMAYDKASYN